MWSLSFSKYISLKACFAILRKTLENTIRKVCYNLCNNKSAGKNLAEGVGSASVGQGEKENRLTTFPWRGGIIDVGDGKMAAWPRPCRCH